MKHAGSSILLAMSKFDEEVMETFGTALKRARQKSGFGTAKEFAEALAVPQHRYRTWERGEHTPDLTTIVRICRLLKVEPNELMPMAVLTTKSTTQSGGEQTAA